MATGTTGACVDAVGVVAEVVDTGVEAKGAVENAPVETDIVVGADIGDGVETVVGAVPVTVAVGIIATGVIAVRFN